jgi:hypothetical protein
MKNEGCLTALVLAAFCGLFWGAWGLTRPPAPRAAAPTPLVQVRTRDEARAPCGHEWAPKVDDYTSNRSCVEGHTFMQREGTWVPWDGKAPDFGGIPLSEIKRAQEDVRRQQQGLPPLR